MTTIDMKGKAALVTGAAAGLGRATALKLAEAGADVCLVDINAEGLKETSGMARALGVRALVHATDLARNENCHAAVAAAVAEFGRLDGLCNIAGVMFLANTPEMPADQWDKTLAINLSAPFFLIQAAIPHLIATEGGIVNVTSCAAFIGEAYLAAYCATKAGLNHLTKALAMEYIHQGVRINAVAPGGMMTGLAQSFRPPEGADIALLKRFSPLRGMVEIDDVADLVAFLASPASRGYHGACISIDAGITAG